MSPAPATVPWLWLYGPPVVGRSATGFELFEQLLRRGSRVAVVELDQLGMCFPALTEARTSAKTHNLLGMLGHLDAAGADGVVVSGDVVETMQGVLESAARRPRGHDASARRPRAPSRGDLDGGMAGADGNDRARPASGVPRRRPAPPSSHAVALTATPATLQARATRRRQRKELWLPGDDLFACDEARLDEVVDGAAAFDAGDVDVAIATDGRAPQDVAAQILRT